jgi:RNA polymerase sigma-70 factor (ECF subfamily)
MSPALDYPAPDIRPPMVQSPGPGQDTEYFVRLFIDGQREILRYILSFVPNVEDAHDILQETAAELWKKFDEYDRSRPFVPWARRFAFVQVLRYREQLVRRSKYLSLELINRIAAVRQEEAEMLEERRLALVTCVEQLGDPERFLVEQRYASGMSVAKLSEVTGQEISTLYKALMRIRRQLFECINRKLGRGGSR